MNIKSFVLSFIISGLFLFVGIYLHWYHEAIFGVLRNALMWVGFIALAKVCYVVVDSEWGISARKEKH